MRAKYKFVNETGDSFYFEQRPLPSGEFVVDSNSGYSRIEEIENYKVYYRNATGVNYYLWYDDKYTISFMTNKKLSNEKIILILDEIIIK